ncbi:hypothetical protein J7E62_05225 [Variovorax paradoxus]|nr:hypothetical protein [Variovorax paradoxus]
MPNIQRSRPTVQLEKQYDAIRQSKEILKDLLLEGNTAKLDGSIKSTSIKSGSRDWGKKLNSSLPDRNSQTAALKKSLIGCLNFVDPLSYAFSQAHFKKIANKTNGTFDIREVYGLLTAWENELLAYQKEKSLEVAPPRSSAAPSASAPAKAGTVAGPNPPGTERHMAQIGVATHISRELKALRGLHPTASKAKVALDANGRFNFTASSPGKQAESPARNTADGQPAPIQLSTLSLEERESLLEERFAPLWEGGGGSGMVDKISGPHTKWFQEVAMMGDEIDIDAALQHANEWKDGLTAFFSKTHAKPEVPSGDQAKTEALADDLKQNPMASPRAPTRLDSQLAASEKMRTLLSKHPQGAKKTQLALDHGELVLQAKGNEIIHKLKEIERRNIKNLLDRYLKTVIPDKFASSKADSGQLFADMATKQFAPLIEKELLNKAGFDVKKVQGLATQWRDALLEAQKQSSAQSAAPTAAASAPAIPVSTAPTTVQPSIPAAAEATSASTQQLADQQAKLLVAQPPMPISSANSIFSKEPFRESR